MSEIFIDTPHITVGQFLKHVSIISSGGEANFFIQENKIIINNDKNKAITRGVKLFDNDLIFINDSAYKIKHMSN